jgi:Holliday junction resolvase
MEPQKFVIVGEVMGKPRMNRSVRYAPKPEHLRYWAWKDWAISQCPGVKQDPIRVDWVAYLPIPPSWSQKKKDAMRGQIHRQKPDRDNIDKGLLDALWKRDECVGCGYIEKRWDDGKGPRLEITVW